MVKFTKRPPLSVLVSLLTLVFVILQVRFYSHSLANAGALHIIVKHAVTIDLIKSKSVLLPLIGYLTAQFVLYTFVIFYICYVTRSISKVMHLRRRNSYLLAAINTILCFYFVITANAIYFPLSVFAFDTNLHIIWQLTYKSLFYLTIGLLSVQIIISLQTLLQRLRAKSINKFDTITLCSMMIIIAISLNLPTVIMQLVNKPIQTTQQPNIILVSIEALRPDFINSPYRHSIAMPFLASQLKQSINFTDAYTPIAQSFPSWMSLLTAKTPLHNGSRSLYTNYQQIDLSESLTKSLKQANYQTFYMVDGQRFGDITESIGFDHVIGPPYGAAELLIGSISDFPLSNLIVTTRLGKWLFPYSYGNRSIIATYHPRNFNELIADGLQHRNDKPIFIGVHFGLSHWPFRWGNDRLNDSLSMPAKYTASLHTADRQIQSFFNTLEKEQLLQNAIIIFISDHGIGLGMPGDKLTSEENYQGGQISSLPFSKQPYSIAVKNKLSGIDTSYGYSTDILSLNQYHILMAIKGAGLPTKQSVNDRVSLMDITPTLLSILQLPAYANADGQSLTPLFNKLPEKHINRNFFLENGFTTPEIAAVNISINKVLQSSVQSVQFEPTTGLLYINSEAQKTLLKNKQRAILDGDWLLARYPDFYRQQKDANNMQANSQSIDKIHVPPTYILMNIKNRKWTTDLKSAFAALAPVKQMQDKFKAYNANEI